MIFVYDYVVVWLIGRRGGEPMIMVERRLRVDAQKAEQDALQKYFFKTFKHLFYTNIPLQKGCESWRQLRKVTSRR